METELNKDNSEVLAGKFVRHYEDFEQPLSMAQRVGHLLVTTPVVEGLDINRFQRGEVLDPAAIYASGRRFIILEAVWGLWVPPSFAEFWPPLLDAGFIMLAYGFFRGDQGGSAQADLLLETARPMFEAQGFWMPLFSDVEPFTGDTSTVGQRVGNWRAWVNGIRSEITPGAYSNIPSWQSMMANEPLPPDCLGWTAHYADTSNPLVPANWPRSQTPFHQYGVAKKYPWCPPVPGMASDVDVDRYYGTLEQLWALGSDAPIPPEPPGDNPMLLEHIEQAQLLAAELSTLLDTIHSEASEVPVPTPEPPPPPPPPPPPAEETVNVKVTREPKAVAQYSLSNNGSGNPIMEPYPRGGTSDQRITWNTGAIVKVAATKVQGDGGRFWKIAERNGRAGETLYFKEDDVAKV